MSEGITSITMRYRLTFQHSKELTAIMVSRHGWLSKIIKLYNWMGAAIIVAASLLFILFIENQGWIERYEADGAIVGLFVGYVSMFLILLFRQLLMRGLWRREFADEEECQIMLNSEGMHWRSEKSLADFAWNGFSGVFERPTGVVLYCGGTRGIVLPDDALPEGLGRKELLDRIRYWRGDPS